jgi:uncharacterized protein
MSLLRSIALFILLSATGPLTAADKIRVLIIDGQNNHQWQVTTPILHAALTATGHFDVTVSTAPPTSKKAPPEVVAALPEQWKAWRPDFTAHQVVISNYNGELWPDEVRTAFEKFVAEGGGFVSIHAADNSFPEWPEYNRMIGVGGWGGRTEKDGPRLYVVDGKLMRDSSVGKGGAHGPQHEFQITHINTDHPITAGLPTVWMHTKDELYNSLRGPAENLTVLATAVSEQTKQAEPMFMVIDYHKGRVVHNVLGHADYSMQCHGFMEILERSVEWAATGKVERTAAVAATFPSADQPSPVAAD